MRGDIFRFALQKSGKRPLELLVPVDHLPREFQRITVEADKATIATALEIGLGSVAGLARYGEPTVSLKIY